MATSPYDRGVRAALRGRSSNPFLKRSTASYRRRAAEWAEGYASVSQVARQTLAEFRWLPMEPVCHPQAGDYPRRERGLEKLFRPQDAVEWDVLRAAMAARVVSLVPQWAGVPYAVLRAYAGTLGVCLGEEPQEFELQRGHPVKYLWSALRLQGVVSQWPALVTSAYEELVTRSQTWNGF